MRCGPSKIMLLAPAPNHIMTMSGVVVVLDAYCKLLTPLPFSACCALMKFSRSRHRISRFSLRRPSVLLYHSARLVNLGVSGLILFKVCLHLHSNIAPDIKPFVLHMLSEEEAHLCPVRALGDWLAASKINRGFIFRKIVSGDRIAEVNRPMVHHLPLTCGQVADWRFRPLNSSWSSFGTIFWTLGLIFIPMEPTHFVVE